MRILQIQILVLISIIGISCTTNTGKTVNKTNNKTVDLIECLNTKEEKRGKKYRKSDNHFQIELPEKWHIITDFENGISGSDTLAKIEDYDLIGLTEFINEDFDFEEEYRKLIQGLKRKGKVGSMTGTVKILQEGETKISGNKAKWILIEDSEISETLGSHARINYFFQVEGSKNYYIIYNESYGEDKIENLCELKKITNTFKYLK